MLWGQKVKYLLLAGLVALYVTRQEKLLTGTSPWEVFSRLTALRLPPEGFGVGIALFVLILLGMAVQPRFFCQFLCLWERCSPCCRCCPLRGCTGRAMAASRVVMPASSSAGVPEAGGKQPAQRGVHRL